MNGNIHLRNIVTLPVGSVGSISRSQRLRPYFLLSCLLPPAGNLPTAWSDLAPKQVHCPLLYPNTPLHPIDLLSPPHDNCGYGGLHPSAISVATASTDGKAISLSQGGDTTPASIHHDSQGKHSGLDLRVSDYPRKINGLPSL